MKIWLSFLFVLLFSNGVSGEVFFDDSLESGDFSYTGTNGSQWGGTDRGSSNVSVSTDYAHTGAYSIKLDFTSGLTQRDFNLGENMSEMYLQFWLRLPNNWSPSDDSNNKFTRLWGDDYGTDGGKAGASTWERRIKGELKLGGAWPLTYRCDGNMGTLRDEDSYTMPDTFDEEWHLFEQRFKRDDGSGSAAYMLWVDGVLQIDAQGLVFENSPPCYPGYFREGYLLGAANSGFDNDTYVYIDDVVFSTTYIGLDGSGEVGPTRSGKYPSLVLDAGTTDVVMSLDTDVNATCKYDISSKTYANLLNTFSGSGTQDHTQALTGLTNGSSATYYVKCEKTSDSEKNDTDYLITVAVSDVQHTLTASKDGTGNGTLTSNPSGINCGSDCTEDYEANTSVVVTATPDGVSEFTTWSECDSPSGNECTVSMTGAKSVTATFTDVGSQGCDIDNYWACTVALDCTDLGFYYWENACRTVDDPGDMTGVNVFDNADFSTWATSPGIPDQWDSWTNPANISDNEGGCQLISESGETSQVYQDMPETKTYKYVINIRSMSGSLEIWTEAENQQFHYTAETVTGLISYASGDRNVYIQVPDGTVDTAVIDDIVIKEYSPAETGAVSTGSMPLIN